ncbi:unnamed protein product [Paramecium pentaurelia]|uniref:Uncharacterized protein n=1 Tax=Paramecium pentaurelia TaxID=43138 RepID=A0A8S1UYG7_9CILI|nr:unnamed protein product [Paramecium pentaurelia]
MRRGFKLFDQFYIGLSKVERELELVIKILRQETKKIQNDRLLYNFINMEVIEQSQILIKLKTGQNLIESKIKLIFYKRSLLDRYCIKLYWNNNKMRKRAKIY